jgi:hypothetical protein
VDAGINRLRKCLTREKIIQRLLEQKEGGYLNSVYKSAAKLAFPLNSWMRGQFILSHNSKPKVGWAGYRLAEWTLHANDLPVVKVLDQDGKWIGWCIGHLVLNGKLNGADLTINEVEEFYQQAAGKWALFLVEQGRIYLDPYGSLACVYSAEREIVASTPTLVEGEWDEEILHTIGLPEKDTWLPSGLTTMKNVKRLLPNHYLHLDDFTSVRHWPTSDLSIDPHIDGGVRTIASSIQNTIDEVAKVHPISFTLTAGRDSRMILASARAHAQNATFVTFAEPKETLDMQTAERLAKQLNLQHEFIPIRHATEEELQTWLSLTGVSLAGGIWKIHKTLEKLDRTRVLFPGTAGEVGRAFYWKSSDSAHMKLTVKDILTRCRLPHHSRLTAATDQWLKDLQDFNAFTILDLSYIEQRLGCWAAPSHYGNTTSLFEFSLFNSRPVFEAMMRLPYEYRKKQMLPQDLCNHCWPDVLQLPFNQYTGFKGIVNSSFKRAKVLTKMLLQR